MLGAPSRSGSRRPSIWISSRSLGRLRVPTCSPRCQTGNFGAVTGAVHGHVVQPRIGLGLCRRPARGKVGAVRRRPQPIGGRCRPSGSVGGLHDAAGRGERGDEQILWPWQSSLGHGCGVWGRVSFPSAHLAISVRSCQYLRSLPLRGGRLALLRERVGVPSIGTGTPTSGRAKRRVSRPSLQGGGSCTPHQ